MTTTNFQGCLIIGLSGSFGSGKTTRAQYLSVTAPIVATMFGCRRPQANAISRINDISCVAFTVGSTFTATIDRSQRARRTTPKEPRSMAVPSFRLSAGIICGILTSSALRFKLPSLKRRGQFISTCTL